MYMRMCVCMCVCVYLCVYVCVCVYVYASGWKELDFIALRFPHGACLHFCSHWDQRPSGAPSWTVLRRSWKRRSRQCTMTTSL